MGKEQALGDPYGVPTGSVPRSPWGPLMHEEPIKEQMARGWESGPGKWDQPCANTQQIAGTHYKGKAIQPWDYVAANELGYFEGTAIKYLTRWKDKGGVDDLRKAVHFIEKLIELQA